MHPCGRFNRNSLVRILELVYVPQKLRPAHRLDANTTGVGADGSMDSTIPPRDSMTMPGDGGIVQVGMGGLLAGRWSATVRRR